MVNQLVKNASTIIFDCDGVLLDSNNIKTLGFMEISNFAGPTVQNNFIQYHLDNPGISRFKKIDFLIEN
jgi:beta-phosphoglucomutase-like phosphatase (HAD superfamily)